MFKKLFLVSTFAFGILMSSFLPPISTLATVPEEENLEEVPKEKEEININQQLGEFITDLTSALQGQTEENQALIIKELSNKLDVMAVLAKEGQIEEYEFTIAESTSAENNNFNFEIPQNDALSKAYKYDENTKEYKQLTHEEAMAYNPLHHVNTKRDSLILDAIEKEKDGHQEPWLEYRKFSYKQAPYNFEMVDGKPVYNKYYYGTLIKTAITAMREALFEGDDEKVAAWERSFVENLEKFKEAPGQVPYVVGLNHLPSLAKEYGVEQADLKTWKDPKKLWEKEGRMWWENPVFKEHPELLENSLNAATKYGTDVSNVNKPMAK